MIFLSNVVRLFLSLVTNLHLLAQTTEWLYSTGIPDSRKANLSMKNPGEKGVH